MFHSFAARVHGEIRKQYPDYATEFTTKDNKKGQNEHVEHKVEVDLNAFGLRLVFMVMQVNDGIATISVHIETGVYAFMGYQVFEVGRQLMMAAEMERWLVEYVKTQGESKQSGVLFYNS